MRWLQTTASIASALVAIACSRSESRARDEATTLDDRRPIPAPPATQTGAARWLPRFTKRTPAAGVTPLDEVPDSTWFTNRNAVRRLSPAAIRKGPALHEPPRDGRKWVVIGMKQTGFAIGMRGRDEAGDAFFLKFDPRGHDEVETGADVVVQRLLFAAGYNVPENDIVYLTREALSVEPPLRDEDIDTLLARAAREPDGRYRALASRVIPGEPIGGIAAFGTRVGDPNDRIPHEHRRDMRGLYSLAAWLNHTDIKPANTLDVWIPDRGDPSRGHVVHYLLDFGKALGAMARIDGLLEAGFAHDEEVEPLVARHAVTRMQLPWAEMGPFPDLRGLGFIESARFDPTSWRTLDPWLPFENADRLDKFWGARIVASFTREQIRAALTAARYSDPRTVEYLTRVLLDRQRKTLEHLLRDVAPLERFEVRDGALCFVDLWTRHALGGPDAKYTAVHSNRQARVKRDGTVCFDDVASDRPTVVEIQTERAGHDIPPTRIHIGTPGVTAIERL